MKKNQQGFSPVEIILVAVIIGLIIFVGWYVVRARQQANTSQNPGSNSSQKDGLNPNVVNEEAEANPTGLENTNQPADSSNQIPSKPSGPDKPQPTAPRAFDIVAFYNAIQNGMTVSQVSDLAGKSGDCGQTNSMPPSQFCAWTDGAKTVSVSFGTQNAVVSKSKTGF